MMIRALLILVLLSMAACTGKSASTKVYGGTRTQFDKFVNQRNLVGDRTNASDKTLVNSTYPFEISLYKNGRFHYVLSTLRSGGTGTGTWKFTDNKLELRAELPIFDMYVEMYGSDPEFNKTVIEFTDRFGHKQLTMDNSNF